MPENLDIWNRHKLFSRPFFSAPASFIFLFITCAIFTCILPTQSIAGGFEGPGAQKPVTLVQDVAAAPDDMPSILVGRIIEKVRSRKNRYIFEDESGRVIVEIKKPVFGNLTITPEDLIQIEGEVDTDDKYPNEVEVDILRLVPQ